MKSWDRSKVRWTQTRGMPFYLLLAQVAYGTFCMALLNLFYFIFFGILKIANTRSNN